MRVYKDSHIFVILIFLKLSASTPWPGISSSSFYYKEGNVDYAKVMESGTTVKFWTPSASVDQSDWTITPPFVTKVEMIVGSEFPEGGSYWLNSDAYYVVTKGNITLSNRMDEVLTLGDTYWVMGGHVHGPLLCEISDKDSGCDIIAMTTT